MGGMLFEDIMEYFIEYLCGGGIFFYLFFYESWVEYGSFCFYSDCFVDILYLFVVLIVIVSY